MSHQTKKSLGQHFLSDPAMIEKIVRAIAPMPGDRLVEIGPGAGAITRPLLQRHRTLTVIEFDRDLIEPLTALGAELGAELSIVHADVLTVDFTALAGTSPIRLVGNLPYNISSPILFHALEHLAVIRDMHFMLQKEVVDRMAAAPGSKVYGRLSVMLQARCRVTPLFKFGRGAAGAARSCRSRSRPAAAFRTGGARGLLAASQDLAQRAFDGVLAGTDRSGGHGSRRPRRGRRGIGVRGSRQCSGRVSTAACTARSSGH